MLKGKMAVVTGASRGIGRAIALRFAENGADLVVCGREQSTLDTIAGEIRTVGRKALPVVCDVSRGDQCKALFAKASEAFSSLDILVNNAGVTRDGLLMRMKEEDWDFVLSVNLKGAFHCCKNAARIMTKQRSGSIINVTSVIGLMGNAGQTNYAASKAGIIGLTKSLAKELGSREIRVNAIAPGFIETSLTGDLPEKIKTQIEGTIPFRRCGTSDEIAGVALFLASPLSSYVTGEVMRVDGGMAM